MQKYTYIHNCLHNTEGNYENVCNCLYIFRKESLIPDNISHIDHGSLKSEQIT